jgi:hypothetical protein
VLQFTGAVLNKVGEEVNDKFSKKKDGNPKARTTVSSFELKTKIIGQFMKFFSNRRQQTH